MNVACLIERIGAFTEPIQILALARDPDRSLA